MIDDGLGIFGVTTRFVQLLLSIHGAVAFIDELDGGVRNLTLQPFRESSHFLSSGAFGAIETEGETEDDLGNGLLVDDLSDPFEWMRFLAMDGF